MIKSAVRTFDDLPGVKARIEERIEKGHKTRWVVVEQDEYITYDQIDLGQKWLGLEESVREIIADREWDKKVRAMICPYCGGKLVKNAIKAGRHKGHGTISCSECNRVLVRQ